MVWTLKVSKINQVKKIGKELRTGFTDRDHTHTHTQVNHAQYGELIRAVFFNQPVSRLSHYLSSLHPCTYLVARLHSRIWSATYIVLFTFCYFRIRWLFVSYWVFSYYRDGLNQPCPTRRPRYTFLAPSVSTLFEPIININSNFRQKTFLNVWVLLNIFTKCPWSMVQY
jgi:hypothetical protein